VILPQSITRSTLNSGGVRSSSPAFIINGSVSQNFISLSTSPSRELGSGFWYAMNAPVIITSNPDNPDDIDSDGVTQAIEDAAPNSGDGNNDGIADSKQAEVTSILIEKAYVTLEILSSCPELQNVSEAAIESNSEYIFPFGAVEFDIPCAAAEIKLYFHNTEDLTGFNYRKQRSNGTWFNFKDAVFNTEIIDGKSVGTVILQLQDGFVEDNDGEFNGRITDPGSPALLASSSTIPIWDWWHLAFVGLGLVFYFWRKR
jgi:hypothetical protein